MLSRKREKKIEKNVKLIYSDFKNPCKKEVAELVAKLKEAGAI